MRDANIRIKSMSESRFIENTTVQIVKWKGWLARVASLLETKQKKNGHNEKQQRFEKVRRV